MHHPHHMLLVALLAALLAEGAAQDAKFSSDVKVVALLATVHDSNGATVKNLTKDDFRLEEDGHPQTICYFSPESDLPLTVGLLVDTSRSMLTFFAEECIAGGRFFEHVLREDSDSAAVLHFDRNIRVLQEFTSSREKLTSALTQLKIPAQGESDTRLYDAVRYASDALMQKRSGPKAFILLSDGMDVRSQTTSIATAIEYAQRADTMIYSILIGDRSILPGRKRGRSGDDPKRGPIVMARLARETGGGFFKVSARNPVDKIYAQIEEDLRSQYSIGYTPNRPDANGKYRKLKLTTTQPGLVVGTRDGYSPK
jgi:VWFA-related protein